MTNACWIAVATLALTACGVGSGLNDHPGHAAFELPDRTDAQRRFAIALGPLPLNLVRRVMQHDPEIAAMLHGLSAVRVYVYRIDGDGVAVDRRIEATMTRLGAAGWEPLLTVREDGERVSVLVRPDGDRHIHGLAVMARDTSGAVFLNLFGDLRPEALGAALSKLDIGPTGPHADAGADGEST